jgi:hypothetical protein
MEERRLPTLGDKASARVDNQPGARSRDSKCREDRWQESCQKNNEVRSHSSGHKYRDSQESTMPSLSLYRHLVGNQRNRA